MLAWAQKPCLFSIFARVMIPSSGDFIQLQCLARVQETLFTSKPVTVEFSSIVKKYIGSITSQSRHFCLKKKQPVFVTKKIVCLFGNHGEKN